MLSDLLHRKSKRGRVASIGGTLASQRKRVNRPDKNSLSAKVGTLFEQVILELNKVYDLCHYPLTLEHTLKKMTSAERILKQVQASKKDAILAESTKDIINVAGRACTRGIVGTIGKGNQNGKLSTAEVAAITGKSKGYVRRCVKKVVNGDFGAISSLSKCGLNKPVERVCPTRLDPELGECLVEGCRLLHECLVCRNGLCHSAASCQHDWTIAKATYANKRRIDKEQSLTRNTVHEAEYEATRHFMTQRNPARSGDVVEICWMLKGRSDFYFEENLMGPVKSRTSLSQQWGSFPNGGFAPIVRGLDVAFMSSQPCTIGSQTSTGNSPIIFMLVTTHWPLPSGPGPREQLVKKAVQ